MSKVTKPAPAASASAIWPPKKHVVKDGSVFLKQYEQSQALQRRAKAKGKNVKVRTEAQIRNKLHTDRVKGLIALIGGGG